jgi:hypothetical protein
VKENLGAAEVSLSDEDKHDWVSVSSLKAVFQVLPGNTFTVDGTLRLSAVVTELPAIAARRHTGGPAKCGGKRACLDESKRATDLGYGHLSLQQ